MIFNIKREPYEEGQKIFNKNQFEIGDNSIVCFVGCNGSGKSSLVNEIIDNLKNEKATNLQKEVYKFNFGNTPKFNDKLAYILFNKNSENNGSMQDHFFNSMELNYMSTGEGILRRNGRALQVIGQYIREHRDTELYIFFDDCDAGTSIDAINDIKPVFSFIINDCLKRNINCHIILTANSFEMCKDLDCIDVQTFKHKHFKTYDSFKKFVLKSREKKNKRDANE